jgi:hypothetical protein
MIGERVYKRRTDLESSGTPIHELDRSFGLDAGDCSLHVLGSDVATVQQATSHCGQVRKWQEQLRRKTYCICPLSGHISPEQKALSDTERQA